MAMQTDTQFTRLLLATALTALGAVALAQETDPAAEAEEELQEIRIDHYATVAEALAALPNATIQNRFAKMTPATTATSSAR